MSSAEVQSNTSLLPPESPGEALRRVNTDHLSASEWYTAEKVAQRVQIVQQIFRTVMKEGTHYGVIPGCEKPSLWKAGAEQLMMTFRLAAAPVADDLSTPDCARYRVTVNITHAPTQMFLGAGIGECSSDETKYKWRSSVCTEEYEATSADRRRMVWKKGQRNPYTIFQVRTEPADQANTALKMAKKRSLIDAVLTVTGASDMFTQDLEDMENPVDTDEHGNSPQPEQQKAPVAMPQRKGAAPAPVATTQKDPNNGKWVAGPMEGKLCPQCDEQLEANGCHHCGFTPQQPPLQPRQYGQPAPPSTNFRQPQQHHDAPTQSARAPQGEKISDAQDRRFFAKCMGNGITKSEMNQYLQERWGISNSRDIVKGEMYEECCRWADGETR